jgi:hypothetical protein
MPRAQHLILSLAAMAGPAHSACFDLVKQPRITLSGKLVERVFPGPPNFENVAQGDAREPSYILELAASICADDRDFIAAKQRVWTVHLISVGGHDFYPALRRARGKHIKVYGEVFGAQTGHHHAPLVLVVDRVGFISGRGRPSATPPPAARHRRG